MLSVQQLTETNNVIQQCHQKLTIYPKLNSVKSKLQFLSTIWNPHHLTKPTKYTPAIAHLHLKAGQYAHKTAPANTEQSLPQQQIHKQAIKYQQDLAAESDICYELIELHIFWLQANIDLFLQCDISTPEFTSQQLLHRIYDQLVRYLTAELFTASASKRSGTGIQSQQTSPSLIQFIPYPYLKDILTDFVTSPAFIAAIDRLLPTHRSLLIAPPSVSTLSDGINKSTTNQLRYHNIFTFLYVILHEKLQIIQQKTLTEVSASLLTAFPTLLGGFTYVCTHFGLNVDVIGQLLVDMYLVRGYKQRILQEQQYMDLSLEQLFSRWTNIALQTLQPKNQQLTQRSSASSRLGNTTPRGGSNTSNVVDKAERYNKLGSNWAHLLILRHNLLRSILDLYSVDQIADKAMRKAQFLTKKKQKEYQAKFLHLKDGRDNVDGDHSNAHVSDFDTNLEQSNISTPKLNQSTPKRHLGDEFHRDDDVDSRGDDFDHFNDEFDDLDAMSDHDSMDGRTKNDGFNKFDDFSDFTSPKLKNNLHSPKITPKPTSPPTPTSPTGSNNNTNTPTSPVQNLSPNNPTSKPTSPQIPTSILKQCDEYDIDESKTFKEIDQYVLYQSTFAPRYTNSQQYLLQATVQRPTLMNDINIMVQEFDAFQVSISIDEEGETLVQIHPPKRHKIIEMNEDDIEYLEQQRAQQIIRQQKEMMVKKGLISSDQANQLGNMSADEMQQLLQDFGLNNGSSNLNIFGDILSATHSLDQTYRSRNTVLSNSVFGGGKGLIYDPLNPNGSGSLLRSSSIIQSTSPFSPSANPNDGTLSIFSGRSGITLGGGMGSTTQRSLLLTSVTSTQTIKSLLSPTMNFDPNSVSSSNQNGTPFSPGFLASPLALSPMSNLANTSISPRNNNPTTQLPKTSSSRTTQFTFQDTNTGGSSSTATTTSARQSSQQPNQSANGAFIIVMAKLYQNRTTRQYNHFIHPRQQQLIKLFEQQSTSHQELQDFAQGGLTNDVGFGIEEGLDPQAALLLKHNPWGLVIAEGEGLSEWNPLEYHFFSLITRLLPLYPLLIPFTHGFSPLLTSFQPSPYSIWAKLLHLLFGRQLGRREFIIEGSNNNNINTLIQTQQYEKIASTFKSEIMLLSQMLFIIGNTLETVLTSYELTYPTINLGDLYQKHDLIDPTSNEFHDDSMYTQFRVNRNNVVTFGGYIHSIRSLYSLLKMVMGKIKQILHLDESIKAQRYQKEHLLYSQNVEKYQQQLEELQKYALEDYKNEMEIYNKNLAEMMANGGGDNQDSEEMLAPQLQEPFLPEVSPTLDEIVANIDKQSILTTCRGEIEEIVFQSYYFYQRYFAFSAMSLPTKGLHYQHHLQIAYKLNEAGQDELPDIDWQTVNPLTNTRSALTLYPQNNIVSIQLAIHKQLLAQKSTTSLPTDTSTQSHIPTTPSLAPSPKVTSTKGPIPLSNLHINTGVDKPTEQDTTSSAPPPVLQLGNETITVTAQLYRKIQAVDKLLHRIFPYYSTNPAGQLLENSTQPPPLVTLSPTTNTFNLNDAPPKFTKGFTTYCVNRIWIDFDLLYDCHTLATCLKLDLMMIDQDKTKIINSATPTKSNNKNNNNHDHTDVVNTSPFPTPTINPLNINLYYMDIFNQTLIDENLEIPFTQIQVDCDGAVVYTPVIESKPNEALSPAHPHPKRMSRPQLHPSVSFDIAEEGEEDEDDDDDIKAITKNKAGGIGSVYDSSNNRDNDQYRHTFVATTGTNRAVEFGTPTKNRTSHQSFHAIAVDSLDYGDDDVDYKAPFEYNPGQQNPQNGGATILRFGGGDDNDEDNDNDGTDLPQLRVSQSALETNPPSSASKQPSVSIAHKPAVGIDYDHTSTPFSTTILSKTDSSSSQKSQTEIEYEKNDMFKCIQRGQPELMLFEYMKPANHSKMDEFVIPVFYNDFDKSTPFSSTLGGTAQPKPQQSFVGRTAVSIPPHGPLDYKTSPGQQSQRSQDDSSIITPQDQKKKKRWFRL